MGWPTLAGAPVHCAHWSHGQVLMYVPYAVDRSQIVYVQHENKCEWALRDCQSVPNVNVQYFSLLHLFLLESYWIC